MNTNSQATTFFSFFYILGNYFAKFVKFDYILWNGRYPESKPKIAYYTGNVVGEIGNSVEIQWFFSG